MYTVHREELKSEEEEEHALELERTSTSTSAIAANWLTILACVIVYT